MQCTCVSYVQPLTCSPYICISSVLSILCPLITDEVTTDTETHVDCIFCSFCIYQKQKQNVAVFLKYQKV